MPKSRSRFFSTCNCVQPHVAETAGLSRRQMLAGGAALAAGAALPPGMRALAQEAKPHRIDVHHHIAPPSWLAAIKRINQGNPPINNWSVQKTLDDMDKGGVAVAITSPTSRRHLALRAPKL